MKCKKCGEEIANNGKYCEFCGTRVSNPTNSLTIVLLILVSLLLIGTVVVFVIFKHNNLSTVNIDEDRTVVDEEMTVVEESMTLVDEKRVINLINVFNNACVENDFFALSNVFSENVVRFHDAYNVNNAVVVEKFRNYDSKFGVYGKYINVRWNTLQIEPMPNDEWSVIYVEDYSIDRIDNTKYSIFVLEKHLILDKDYRIKSIYDVQRSRAKK